MSWNYQVLPGHDVIFRSEITGLQSLHDDRFKTTRYILSIIPQISVFLHRRWFIDNDRKQQTYCEVLSDWLELLTDVRVILRRQPALFHHLQRRPQHVRWSHGRRVWCLFTTHSSHVQHFATQYASERLVPEMFSRSNVCEMYAKLGLRISTGNCTNTIIN